MDKQEAKDKAYSFLVAGGLVAGKAIAAKLAAAKLLAAKAGAYAATTQGQNVIGSTLWNGSMIALLTHKLNKMRKDRLHGTEIKHKQLVKDYKLRQAQKSNENS